VQSSLAMLAFSVYWPSTVPLPSGCIHKVVERRFSKKKLLGKNANFPEPVATNLFDLDLLLRQVEGALASAVNKRFDLPGCRISFI